MEVVLPPQKDFSYSPDRDGTLLLAGAGIWDYTLRRDGMAVESPVCTMGSLWWEGAGTYSKQVGAPFSGSP